MFAHTRPTRSVLPALLAAATLLALPAIANAAPQQQWGPLFHGNYVTLAVGVGDFTSCKVDSRLDDYIRAFNQSIHCGRPVASLKDDVWMSQDFECGRWYALFVWEPGCSRPQWVAVRRGGDHTDVMVNGGQIVCVRDGSSYCRDIVVERTACDVHIISLHIKGECEHGFGFRVTTRCEHIEQPCERPQPRYTPPTRHADPPRVVVVPGRGETRYQESRHDSGRRADDRRDDSRSDRRPDSREGSRDDNRRDASQSERGPGTDRSDRSDRGRRAADHGHARDDSRRWSR